MKEENLNKMNLLSGIFLSIITQSAVLLANLLIFVVTSRLLDSNELAISAIYVVYLAISNGFLNLGFDNTYT